MSKEGRKSTEPATSVESVSASAELGHTYHQPVRGTPVSGRVWKHDLGLPEKASSKIKVQGLKTSWAAKQKRREELRVIRERTQAAKEEREAEYAAEAARIKASRARREANSLKNVKYQVITNTAKLKKIPKGQLKNYRKLADINK